MTMSDPETSLPMLLSSPSLPESPSSPPSLSPPAAVVFRKNGTPQKAKGALTPSICFHLRHASPLILSLIFLFLLLLTTLLLSLLYLSLSSKQSSTSSSSADVCQSEACVTAGNWLHNGINFTVDPCINFYHFACGNWIARNAIPDDKTTINTFILVQDNVTESMRQLLEQRRRGNNNNANSSQNSSTALKSSQSNATMSKVVQLALDFYSECRDQDARDRLGVAPLKDLLQQLLGTSWPILNATTDDSDNSSSSSKSLNVSFIETYLGFRAQGINPIIGFGVSTNLSDTEKNIVSFYGPSFSMGRKQYANESEYSAEIAAFRRYMYDVAVLFAGNFNETLLSVRLEEIYQLEKKLVLFSRPIEESRDASSMNNQMSLGELKLLTSNRLDWTALLQEYTQPFNLSYTIDDNFRVNVEELPYYTNMTELVLATPYHVLANYMAFRMISSFGGYADKRLQAIDFEYSRATSGVKRPVAQWEGCFNTLKTYFDEALTRLYVDHFVEPGTKRVADEMIADLKAAFVDIVQREALWLDEETRRRALEKASATLFNVAYPEWILDDRALDEHYGLIENSTDAKAVETMVKRGHYFESLLAIKQLNRGKWFRELKEPRNRTKHWVLSPTEVNASAGLRSNTIVLPIALLQKPFFDPDRPLYLNYGSIGEVIGHEITHHVDDEGSQHDQFGNLKNWWTEETKKRFAEASTCFIEQYGSIVDYKTGKRVNSINTLGENIADNGAVREAFYAFQSMAKRSKLQLVPKMEAFTFEQLFFIALGQNYCSLDRVEELKRKLDVDPHTPDEYRANTALANFEHFAKAFHCPPGSPMNPRESNRCRLW